MQMAPVIQPGKLTCRSDRIFSYIASSLAKRK